MDSILRVWTVGFQSNFTLSNFSEKNVRPLAVLCVAACMHDLVRPKLTLLAAKGTAQRTCLCSIQIDPCLCVSRLSCAQGSVVVLFLIAYIRRDKLWCWHVDVWIIRRTCWDFNCGSQVDTFDCWQRYTTLCKWSCRAYLSAMDPTSNPASCRMSL